LDIVEIDFEIYCSIEVIFEEALRHDIGFSFLRRQHCEVSFDMLFEPIEVLLDGR
jgi:hypothetical protein